MINEFQKAKVIIEHETGFACYEDMPGQQHTWFGTSDKLDPFKEKAEPWLRTGDIVVLVDTGVSKMYSAFTKQLY